MSGEKQSQTVDEILFQQGKHYYQWCQSQTLDTIITVSHQSQFLCAALSSLASTCYTALGGVKQLDLVSQTATQLALLTKIDDDVIDSLDFHTGHSISRDQIVKRTRSYLHPTLSSIHQATAVNQEYRCQLAASLGQNLRILSSNPKRLQHILAWIERGWEIQAQAVAILTAHPSSVNLSQIKKVSANISGAWLLMITLIGTLPDDAQRTLSDEEEESFFIWGEAIQIADALADLKKDLKDQHLSTVPGWMIFQNHDDLYIKLMQKHSLVEIYKLLACDEIDLKCLPHLNFYQSMSASLSQLGYVAPILRWIHGFLLWRYLMTAESQRNLDTDEFRPFISDLNAQFTHYMKSVAQVISMI